MAVKRTFVLNESTRTTIGDELLAETKENLLTGCMVWKHTTNLYGYGLIRERRPDKKEKIRTVHRVVAWSKGILQNLDDAKTIVRHRCDNPGCCNPEHLLTGTHADNMKDKAERSRVKNQYDTKPLTVKQVVEIKRLYAIGLRATYVWRKYKKKFPLHVLRDIENGKTYAHIIVTGDDDDEVIDTRTLRPIEPKHKKQTPKRKRRYDDGKTETNLE